MNKTQKIKFGNVDLSRPHFLISHSPEYGCEGWVPIGVLSAASTVVGMRLALLVHDIDDRPAIDMMLTKLSFYLFELKEDDPIAYLIYHSFTMSNVYSNIHFSYVESINKKNVIYYILTESKLQCIYNKKSFIDINQQYLDITVNKLLADALDNKSYNDSYNDTLYYLYNLIFKKVPSENNFEIHDQPTVVELAKLLSNIEIDKYCNVLNYLKKIKLIKINEVDRLLNFFHANRRL